MTGKGGGGGGREGCMRYEVQLVQVVDVAGLQCIWCCGVEGLLQYLVQ